MILTFSVIHFFYVIKKIYQSMTFVFLLYVVEMGFH